ncbi:MAG: hypothetical protein Q7S69_10545 [Nitrosomonadaceae bacterium]|nr:hypothetical protein [Nitrosomonadaceae bacterium]
MAAQGFLALHGFLAAQGLHGLRLPARGAQGMQGAAANVMGMPITAPNNPETIAALNGLIWVFMIFLSL